MKLGCCSVCDPHVEHQMNVCEQCLILPVPVNGTIASFDLALHVLLNCDIFNICLPSNDSRTRLICNHDSGIDTKNVL